MTKKPEPTTITRRVAQLTSEQMLKVMAQAADEQRKVLVEARATLDAKNRAKGP